MTRVMLAAFCAFLVLSSCCEPVQAKGFLERLDQVEGLLKTAKDLLGDEHYHFAKKKIGKIEHVLQPIYSSMRKNEHGKLGHAGASYALHRLFGQRQGWHITDLEIQANEGFVGWSDSTPVAVLQKHIPKTTLEALEQQLFKNGFGLHELAIVAATIEQFIHTEAMQLLQNVFMAQDISTGKLLNVEEAGRILDSYNALSLIGFEKIMAKVRSGPNPRLLQKLVDAMPRVYPHWPEMQEFVLDVRESVVAKADDFAFTDIKRVVEETGERFGRWQEMQCRSMTTLLLSKEDTGPGGAGRIRLADFYNLTLQDKQLQFTESRPFLRKTGSLDESEMGNPRVIVTNYVYGSSNCVASSKYYEVCCVNHCEDLMSNLEQEIAGPEATPKQIVDAVTSLASPSHPGGKVISPWLHHQLENLAGYHSGKVPLHGRLFAQWMHSAYPHECPYPHISGASNSGHLANVVTSKQTVADALATEEEMKQLVRSAPPRSERILDPSAHEALGMVSMQEELVI